MASSFRSRFRHPPQPDESISQTQRKQSSRIPTKPNSTSAENKQSTTAQHVSKLAKRASRSITPSERTEHGTKSTGRTTTPMTAAHDPAAASKRTSVVPTSEVAPTESRNSSIPCHSYGLPPPPNVRTPSLVSGSSASTADSPKQNGLRRKPSSIEKYAASKRAETPTTDADCTTMHRRHDGYSDAFEDSMLGISLPPTTTRDQNGFVGAKPTVWLTPDVYSTHQPVTRYITPPVPIYAQSATPSTRYTDSPFSHVPTPSSASSYSPAFFTTSSGATPRLQQQSPLISRPPTSKRPTNQGDSSRLGLPPVRESSTSSSSSTVKPSRSQSTVIKEVPPKSATAPPTRKTSENLRSISYGKQVKEKSVRPSTSDNAKPPVRIPPELAHLNVDPPSKLSLNKALPPLRPSRDGTPNLGMSKPSSVVQSDLPRLFTSYHKRTPSQETNSASAPSPSIKTRFGLSSRASSRQESPRIDSAVSPPPAARTFARGPTPDMAPTEGPRLARRDSPAVGIAPSPSKSPRWGFLSRKSKSEGPNPPEKPKRQPIKGPVAGTGHEGYGRFGFRGRSGSTTSSTGFRSASADSSTSSQQKGHSGANKGGITSKDGPELDDFLRERINPRVLRGSGSTLSNTEAPSMPETSNHTSLDSFPERQLLPSAMNSSVGSSPAKRPSHAARAPSDSSDDGMHIGYPSLAARRSLTKLSKGESMSPPKLPAPIDTSLPPKDSSLDYDAETSAWPPTDSTIPPEDPFDRREGLWLQSHQAQPPVKGPRKWNFFQRAQASPRNKGKGKASVAVGVQPAPDDQPTYREAAHYAMLGPVEPVGLEEVERIMEENETTPEDSQPDNNAPPRIVPYERRHISLLPSPPKLEHAQDSDFKARPMLPTITVRQDKSPELSHTRQITSQHSPEMVQIGRPPIVPEPEPSPEGQTFSRSLPPALEPREDVRTPEMQHASLGTPDTQDSPQRQPRLSPIGRIPKVVSKRDRDRMLPDSSFSRPFARTQPRPTVKPPGSLYTQIRELASPIESGSQPVSSTSGGSAGGSGEQKSSDYTNPSESTNRTSMEIHTSSDFFAFPPRKDSDLSYSSSSGTNSLLAAMAARAPQEEDLWNEYDDLLDEVMPKTTHLSTSSSLGAPFQYTNELYEPSNNLAAPHQLYWTKPPSTGLPPPPRSQTVPSVLSVPQQIARFMQPSLSPLVTPRSFADDVDQSGIRSTSTLVAPVRTSIPSQKRTSLPQSTQSSKPGPNRSSLVQTTSRTSVPSARGSVASSSRYSRNSRVSGHSRSASLPEANARNSQTSLTPSARFNRDTQLLDIPEVDGDEQAAAANLRFGALMTSKWLSFGRVLFSPAHNEMRLADEPRVLIIDGLGSDWSYYVALSYPAATVYNLGPAPMNGTSAWPGVTQKPPSNHRHITHAAISAAFPFPKGFFTAVVLRFPLATTEQAYHACIFECKRVLRPGGYLEVSVLDLDLMNMGNKARKAVRDLKTGINYTDRNVSLRNLSDVLIRMIGRRGFEEMQRCIVGVPAAGRIPRSQDMSTVSSDSSGNPIWQREDQDGQEFSFRDLLDDARASRAEAAANNDERITKMVAKVGRWWYSTCYERVQQQQGNCSIWNDPKLLRECEKQGTSFRLLICFAQKPAQTKRRTVSV